MRFVSHLLQLGWISSICSKTIEGRTLSDPAVFSSRTFDYVVIGGGTSGLVVATRLAEDPNVTVGVIEAGLAHVDDPLVDTPRFFGQAVGNASYDWRFVTVPQPNVANRALAQPRGKMLGGSSALNFLVFHRASAAEYDAWAELGAGKGWDWKGLLPFFRKSEDVLPSNPGQYPGIPGRTATNDRVHGRSGPLNVRFSKFHTDLDKACVQAFESSGIPTNTDPFGGNATGSYDSPGSINHRSGNRSYSATAYYFPNQGRKNLVVPTGALATKIILDSSGDTVVATGVSFLKDGQPFTVNATKEVILAAGSLQTPQILELSGIGNKTLLTNLGIETKVDLPQVGENLQDHMAIVNVLVLTDEAAQLTTLATLEKNSTFAAEQRRLYVEEGQGAYTYSTGLITFAPLGRVLARAQRKVMIRNLEDYLTRIEETIPPFERQQAKISLKLLKEDKVGQVEFVPLPGVLTNTSDPASSPVAMPYWSFGSRLFSHGSVHISSADPSIPPTIDPRYFSNPFDKQIMILGVKTLLHMASKPPFSSLVKEFVGLRSNATDEEIEQYVLKSVGTEFHPIGTASLGRKGKGGVVNENLVVYGTKNIRVVDASVMPAHIAAHTQATVYAVAEKAASIIKKDRN